MLVKKDDDDVLYPKYCIVLLGNSIYMKHTFSLAV